MVVLKLKDGQSVDTDDTETMTRIAAVKEMDRPPLTALDIAEAQEERRLAKLAPATEGVTAPCR